MSDVYTIKINVYPPDPEADITKSIEDITEAFMDFTDEYADNLEIDIEDWYVVPKETNNV